MEYICLDGKDISSDAEKIMEAMRANVNIVFIYAHKTTPLYAYIEELGKYLSEGNQFNLKICYERNELNLSYCSRQHTDAQLITSLSQLIEQLDKDYCRIVVNDDKRSTLAEIVQQLIYIGYPLTKIEIMLKKEEKDFKRAERFMQDIDKLDEKLDSALYSLYNIGLNAYNKAYEKNKETLDSVIDVCNKVKEQINKARNRELKIAVAASKKTGKSVIVNSMIGEELAPTSLEMATPNTCIYTRSKDKKYRLEYHQEKLEFETAEDIYNTIDKEFKRAQENKSGGFAIEDMNIEYASSKNNFEAYTIFDTPGPDAAGTIHSEKAQEAMRQCDVAIFAIDYAKYLTTAEEEYLKDIKELFNSQMKFDSLIFTINKIDARYQDAKTSKSVIKSIDFIRSRLKKIDSCYNDCAIFATSALQYFNALEAEKVCGDELIQSTDLYTDLRPMKKKYEKVKTQLSFLDSMVGYMDSESGVENITLEDLKHYSGMPDLLSYVAYIARTKARNELVNFVAYQIDSEQAKIQDIFKRIDNLKKLMAADDKQIEEITRIFHDLKDNIERILSDEITDPDIINLEGLHKDNAVIKSYQQDLQKQGRRFCFKEIKKMGEEKINKAFADVCSIAKENNIYDMFYELVKERYWKQFEKVKNEKTIVYEGTDLYLNQDTICEIVDEIRQQQMVREKGSTAAGALNTLSNICTYILNDRIGQLDKEIEKAKRELQKHDYNYNMPTFPKFDVTIENNTGWEKFKALDVNVDLVTEKLKILYKSPNLFTRLRENWNSGRWGEKKLQAKDKITKEDFEEQIGNAKGELVDIVKEIEMEETVRKDGKQLSGDVIKNMSNIIEHFKKVNVNYKVSVEKFTHDIDDRKVYKEDIQRLEEEEAFIYEIEGNTRAFIETWEKIINPIQSVEEGAERETA